MFDGWLKKTAAAAVMAVSIFLLFWNLGDRLLWLDEAETALLAINITEFGVPKATDGKNYVTLYGRGNDTNKDDVWTWSPWADEYAAAASFAMLGRSAFSARLPFALFGLASILMFAFLAQKVFKRYELTLIGVLLFMTNVGFLLHARQCRYYALVIFAQSWFMYGFCQLLERRDLRGIINTFLPLVLQFYCNYVLVLPNIIVLASWGVFLAKKAPGFFRNAAVSVSLVFLSAVPWLLYAKPWTLQSRGLTFKGFWQGILMYLDEMNFYVVPLVLLAVPLLAMLFFTARRKWKKKEINKSGRQGRKHDVPPAGDSSPAPSVEKYFTAFLWVTIPVFLSVLGMVSIRSFRYLVPLMPVVFLLSAVILVKKVKYPALRLVAMLIICFSNILSFVAVPFSAQHRIEFPIIEYAGDITSRYDNALKDIVTFFRANASPDDSVFTPGPDFPLIFHTGLRITDIRMNPDADMNKLPEWILSESASGLLKMDEVAPPEQIRDRYEAISLEVRDNSRSDNRPDPNLHSFKTSTGCREFIIYRKKQT